MRIVPLIRLGCRIGPLCLIPIGWRAGACAVDRQFGDFLLAEIVEQALGVCRSTIVSRLGGRAIHAVIEDFYLGAATRTAKA